MGCIVLIALLAIVLIAVVASRAGASRSAATSTGPTKRSRAKSQRVSLETKSVEKAREAWLSGDLQRMINALGSKAKLVDRHFLLMTVIKETYRLRDDPRMADKCLEVAQMHIDEFPKIRSALKREFGDVLPRVPSFTQLATLLTERGEFDRALQVCERAVAFGLDDGTKSGYEGRIARIRKKAARREEEEVSASGAQPSAASEIVASRTEVAEATEGFSEPHRRRKRRIKPEMLNLDTIPFVSLPRAPHHWEERDASEVRKEDEGAEEFFELLGEPGWDLSAPEKLPQEERPDPAYRLHFSARSGTFLIDDLGRAAAYPGAPAASLAESRTPATTSTS